jgi:endonuclease YncB( thermonuclease family)
VANDGVVSLVVVLVAGGALWWWLSQRSAEPLTPASPTVTNATSAPAGEVPAGAYAVQWVTDGDTIAIGNAQGQRLANVRILGLNAPELAHNGAPAECYGAEARDQLRKLLQGKQIRLIDDSRAPQRDRFGRRLGYVEVGGQDVATLMIRGGWAVEFHLPSAGPGDRSDTYARAEDEAAVARRGIWKACQAKPTAD